MCDFSERLIAWLDRELAADEAADVERHVQSCSECRSDVDAYKRVSSEFEAYCDEAVASSNVRPEELRWLPLVSATGAVAAALALFLVWPRTPVQPPTFHPLQESVAASAPDGAIVLP